MAEIVDSSSSHDSVFANLGLEPLADKEELDSFLQALSESNDAAEFSAMATGGGQGSEGKPIASGEAMGDNDVKNIYWVNFDPDKNSLTADQRSKLQVVQNNVDLTTQFLSLKAGIETQKKMDQGQLPTGMAIESQMKRGTYRSKILDYLIRNSAWVGAFYQNFSDRTFSCKKADFHKDLCVSLLKGIGLPDAIYKKLEGTLNEISDNIVKMSRDNTKRMIWIMVTVYTWENQLQIFRPSIRTIYFEANNDVKTYTEGGKKKKEVTDVSLAIGVAQQDCLFNNDVFEGPTRDAVRDFLKAAGVKIINDPIDIPVD